MVTATDDRSVAEAHAAPPRRRPRLIFLLLVLGLVTAAGLGVSRWTADGERTSPAGGPGSPATTAPPTTNSTTTTTMAPDTTALWPFPGSSVRYATPEEAARSFATEYLRFDDPLLDGFQAGDARSGEVPLRPRARGPVTTVLVRQVGLGDDWSVLGAVTANIDVTAPAAFAEVASPVRVAGRALAFEGTVQVEVRAAGEFGAIGAGFVTGGGDVMRPFEGTVGFETPGAPHGALVFFTESAENGQVWEAVAFRVALRSTDIDAAACGSYRSPRPRPSVGQMEAKAYFGCGADDGALRPVYRLVPQSAAVLRAALGALLAGPTKAEHDASLRSWFSPTTAAMLRSVRIAGGHAVVDFGDLRRVIPNASASAGSSQLLAQLDATVFQFRTVETVEYRIEGSCEEFNEWLQYGGCGARARGSATD